MIFHQPGNSRGNFNHNTYTYSDREYTSHFHKNLELICVRKGSMSLTVDGRNYRVEQGAWALILSNQIHAFQIPADAVVWVAVFSEEYVPAFTSHIKGKQGVTPIFCPDASVAELIRCQLMERKSSLLMRKACFYAACDDYLSKTELETRQEKTSFLVGQLLDWIAEHYTEDISLKQTAELFGYEYHYLSRLLNKNYAICFTELLSGYRVEHAVQLLQTTALPVTEIAERSGFQSIRSFNLTFKKHTGMTPNDYRGSN
jgi:AraC-like DNA-binding protein